MPPRNGDFAAFLERTLEARAEAAKKKPEEIGLYVRFNPKNLEKLEFIPEAPYAEALKTLFERCRIVLADENANFDGEKPLDQTAVSNIWQAIFGEESIPVNFKDAASNPNPMTRGDFAIFLSESLGYLTYKKLP